MDDRPTEAPLILANRILKQFSEHLLAGAATPENHDYQVMRVVFRRLGGNWEAVYHGDIRQITMLEKVVTGWGASKKKAG